jgi:Meckel syndrome type 1 protein
MQPTTPPRPTRRLATITPGNDLLTRSGVALALLMLGMPGVALPQTGTATTGPDDYTTVPNDNVWRLASKAIGFAGGDRAAAMVAILRRNPDAFVHGNLHRLKRGVSIVMPSAADIAAEDPRQAALLLDSHLQSVNQNEAAPAPHPLRASAGTPPPVAKVVPAPVAKAPATAPAASIAAPIAAAAPVAPPKVAAPVTRPVASAPAPAVAPAPAPVTAPAKAVAQPAPVVAPVVPPVVAPVVTAPAPASTAASVVAAPASAAAPAPATPAPASAATAVVTPAPVATPARPLPATAGAEPERPLHLLPYAMLGVLLTLPVGWWAYRRRGKTDLRKRLRSASNDFRDSKDSRNIKPKRVEISNAAVEVARAVETLKPTVAMVKLGDVAAALQPSVPALSSAELREQIALKLEIARACIDVGRALVARSLLAAVQQEGEDDERAAAAELMLKLA